MDIKKDKKIQKLAKSLIRDIAEGSVRYGAIDLSNKSDEELQKVVLEYLASFTKKDEKELPIPIIDHTKSILDEARSYAYAFKHEISCLFYATWFEHWLNSMIHTACIRNNLSQQEITQIIRDTNFRAKSTWLLRLLNLKPINKTHLKNIYSIIDARNSFVHYKWKGIELNGDNHKKTEKNLISLLKEIEKTVKYLRNLENKQFFAGRKKKILP